MKRSRFFPLTCSCLKTVDELFGVIKTVSNFAMKQLGPGHSEKVYESVIINELYHRRIPCLRQCRYYSTIGASVDTTLHKSTVETGIVDIEVRLRRCYVYVQNKYKLRVF